MVWLCLTPLYTDLYDNNMQKYTYEEVGRMKEALKDLAFLLDWITEIIPKKQSYIVSHIWKHVETIGGILEGSKDLIYNYHLDWMVKHGIVTKEYVEKLRNEVVEEMEEE
jgi:hypothetical protein